MNPEEDEPNKSAMLRRSLDRAYDPDATENVDNRMIAMMLQLSSDEAPAAPAPDPQFRPGLVARVVRSLRRR